MSTSFGPLVVLVGPPGCGKSTWARKHFQRGQIVSSDQLRMQIAGARGGKRPMSLLASDSQAVNRWVFQARDALVHGRMQLGLPTVVDATNVVAKHRVDVARMRLGCPHGDVPAVAVIFDTPLDVCLEQNSRRHGWRHVPDDVIRAMHATLEAELPVGSTWVPEGFDGGLRIRPDGVWRMGGMTFDLVGLRWLAGSRSLLECPDYGEALADHR